VPSTVPSGTSKAGRHAKACGAWSRRCQLAETTEAGDIPSSLWLGSSTSPRQAKGHAGEFNAVSESGGEMRATTTTGHAAADTGGSLGALCAHRSSEDRAGPRRCGHQRREAGQPETSTQGGSNAGRGWRMHGQQSTHSGHDATSSAVIVTTGPKDQNRVLHASKSEAKLVDFHD
jgi:hypothetical protein